MTELTQFTGLLNIETGQLLDPSVDAAAEVLHAARSTENRIREIKREAVNYLVSVSEHKGTKTLHGERETVTLSGGISTEYDPTVLIELLTDAGCPQDRIDQAVVAEITYKVNRSVLRELRVNPDYRAAIELAEREVEKPYRASVALRRNSGDE